ncbi:hypothetical protein [Providencia hangzhouensis]|uniref:hypothetical protein n=1 Tax=Providencia hangzhouensis TaxID=3031799 RepID=UPI0039F4C818
MSSQQLIDLVKQDWSGQPEIAQACENVIKNIISEKNAEVFRHLTFLAIQKLTDSALTSEDIVRLTQYLSGERVGLFSAGFEYIGLHGQFVLDADNSRYAYFENKIAHPVTGDVINDVKDNVFMFFALNDGVLK